MVLSVAHFYLDIVALHADRQPSPRWWSCIRRNARWLFALRSRVKWEASP
jgi:hypothetical protein